MTGQEVARRDPQAELVARVRAAEFRSQVALALPEGESPERFVRVLVTALQEDPKLATEADPNSVFRSALKSAADGLLPDGREAAFVIYGGKAQYLPMIGGFRKIAGESGWTIQTAVVYERDEFEVELGLEPRLRHVPVRPGAERGPIVAAYAVGTHSDGRREFEVMTRADVEKVQAVSRAKNSGPWVEWWERMAEKTVGRRLFKKLPLGDPARQARIVQAAEMSAEEAQRAIYGPPARAALRAGETVDLETGEVSSADEPIQRANGPTDGGAPAGDTATQQAGGASSGSETDSSGSAPTASSVPEPDLSDEVEKEEDPGAVVIPDGANKGLTLAQVQAKGRKGEEWLKWAAQTPASSSVGHAVHAALQKFRPDLFEATS